VKMVIAPWLDMDQAITATPWRVLPPADAAEFAQVLDRAIDARTRLVSVSQISRHTGRRFPSAALVDVAHLHGVPIFVDGAQAVGAIPVYVRRLGCDFYVFGGHKYRMAHRVPVRSMCGPTGSTGSGRAGSPRARSSTSTIRVT